MLNIRMLNTIQNNKTITMKKNALFLACMGTTLIGLTSCLGDAQNIYSGTNAYATVVSIEAGTNNKILQKDYDVCFYSVETNADTKLNVGDRVLLQTFTLDRDNQPANATGDITKPGVFTAVQHQRITTSSCRPAIENDLTIISDTLASFFHPTITRTVLNDYYLTFRGTALKDVSKTYELYQEKSESDTLIYTFKTVYTYTPGNDVSDELTVFYRSFMVPNMESEQVVKINFPAKAIPASTEYIKFTDKSTVVLRGPKIYENN